ncbi:hypothetical protein [Mycoplasmopsis edwardii]|nr:hypothetical protein [Mycoplasmopsis edwardii]
MNLKIFIWVLLSLFIILFLVVIFFLLRKLILNKLENKNEKLGNEARRIKNSNKTSIQKLSQLAKSDPQFEKLSLDVQKINFDISQKIGYLYKNFDINKEYVKKGKILKSWFMLFRISRIFKKINKKQVVLLELTKDIEYQWEQIDSSFSSILEITEHIKMKLNSKKSFLKHTFIYTNTRANNVRKSYDTINTLKYKGDFQKANSLAEKIEDDIKDLVNKFNSIEKIEYLIFYNLPISIESLKNYNDESFYKSVYNDWIKISNSWSKKDVLTTQKDIIDIYSKINDYKVNNFNKFALNSFIQNNINFYKELLETLEKMNVKNKLSNENFGETIKTIKQCYKSLFGAKKLEIHEALRIIKKILKNSLTLLQNNELQKVLNTFDKNLEKIQKDKVIQLSNNYFWITQNDMLPLNATVDDMTNTLNILYSEGLKNNFKNFFNDKEFMNKWIKISSYLTKVIFENIEYKKMFEELQIHVVKLKLNKQPSKLKETLETTDIYIKNNNFKEAFKIIKNFIKNP